MAGADLEDWEPDTEAKIGSKGALVSYATQTEKLSKDLAERLALGACKDNPWPSRKFKKFLLDNVNRRGGQPCGRPVRRPARVMPQGRRNREGT